MEEFIGKKTKKDMLSDFINKDNASLGVTTGNMYYDNDLDEFVLAGVGVTRDQKSVDQSKRKQIQVKIFQVRQILRDRKAIAFRDKKDNFRIVLDKDPNRLRMKLNRMIKAHGFSKPIYNPDVIKKQTGFDKIEPMGIVTVLVQS